MPAQLRFSSFPGRSLLYVMIASALSISLVSSSKAQTTWTITVDGTNATDPPGYKVSPPAESPTKNCAPASPNPKPSADYLYICRGDIVQWNLITSGGQGLLTIHQKEGFHHGASSSQQWYRAIEKQKLAYLYTAKTDAQYGYEYCVALYDNNGSLYSHDPKIIIGGTNIYTAIETYKNAYTQLLDAITNDPDAKKKTKDQARSQADKLNEQIQKLINLFKK